MNESKEQDIVSDEQEEIVKPAQPEMESAKDEVAEEESTATEKSPEESLLEQLSVAQGKIEELEASFLRARADLENVRRRALRDKEEITKTANARIMEDMLPVLDNFELGFQSAEKHEEGKGIAEGFRMVYAQFKSSLEQHGLLRIDPQGVEFNPNEHEAVSQMPSEEIEEGHVANVVRVGYSLRGKLLRPATVVVSTGASEA